MLGAVVVCWLGVLLLMGVDFLGVLLCVVVLLLLLLVGFGCEKGWSCVDGESVLLSLVLVCV